MGVKRFEDLRVWQEARALASDVYRITDRGSFARDFALKDQLRRASISVMSNIAEGFGRYGPREFGHFLSIARGSSSEVRCQLYLAHDLGYIDASEFHELQKTSRSISRKLAALHRSQASK